MPPKKGASAEADEDERTGLDLLLYTMYAEAFAFRTLKQMKIWDWRLTCALRPARRRVLPRVSVWLLRGAARAYGLVRWIPNSR
jgi:hypothetical protein